MVFHKSWSFIVLFFTLCISACTPTYTPVYTPTSTPTSIPAQNTSPIVREFNLGTIDISTPLLGDAEIVSPLEGIIGLPDGKQAHPLIIILHGRHGICGNFVMEPYPCPEDMPEIRFDIGFAYLVEALAQQGYAAMAINLNAALTPAFGPGAINTRVQQLVDAHINSLQRASSDNDDTLYGVSLAGRIDFSQIGLVGHSAGGGAALSITRAYEGQEIDIDALLLVAAAANFEGEEGIFRSAGELMDYYSTPDDLPVATILPDCDGDQIQYWTQFAYEAARLNPDRSAIAASIRLMRGNHGGFNTALDDFPDARFGYDLCFDFTTDLLAPQDQQDWLSQFTTNYFDVVFHDGTSPLYDRSAPAPNELYGQDVQTALTIPFEDRLVLMYPRDYQERTQNVLGGEVDASYNGISMCLPGQVCNIPIIMPGQFGYMRMMYFGFDKVIFAIPPQFQDIREYASLHIRAVPDYLMRTNAIGESQAFGMVLRDTSGNMSQVDISPDLPSMAIPPPSESYGYDPYMLYPASIRIPLTAFESVDLSQIEAVEFQFGALLTGALLIADIEFLKPTSD
ncbi:MAG: hypothetical protein WBO46_05160 [Caldilineaceae bacterium]